MKKHLLIILIGLTVGSLAQNWSIINPNYTYNYAVDGVYDVSAYALSSEGNNSIFYMNEIVLPCDTCPDIISGALMIHQPTFMQRKIEKIDNAYWFKGNRSFVVLPHASLGDTWLFDTLNNITAEVILETNETIIWGVDDATKYIKLSNNDSIVLSENHGIVRFDISGKSYRLIGVETPTENIGYGVPKFKDFFNFEVGDVFQYRSLECTGNTSADFIKYKKHTILEKTVKGDSIIYIVNKQYASGITAYCMDTLLPNEDNYYTSSTDTLVFVNSVNHFTNLYNYELYTTSGDFMGTDTTFYEYVSCYQDEGGVYKAYSSNSASASVPYYFAHPEYSSLILPPPMDTYTASIQSAYCVGLGLVYSEKEQFESVLREQLIGYVKNGDTTGVVYSDGFYSSVEYLENQSSIYIYPNPAKEVVYIKNLPNQVSVVELCDITGKTVKAIDINKTQSIDVKNLKQGIYFIKIGRFVQKFIKQ